jgi:hypothetical protein
MFRLSEKGLMVSIIGLCMRNKTGSNEKIRKREK